MSSLAPAAVISPGDHLVPDADLERVFTQALAQGGYVILRPWQDFARKPDGSLELEWQWLMTVGGAFHGYSPGELMLDLAVPMPPGSEAARDPDTLDRRGRIARSLGLGGAPSAPEAGPATTVIDVEPEPKVLQLPTPAAPPPDPWAPDDPTLFPG